MYNRKKVITVAVSILLAVQSPVIAEELLPDTETVAFEEWSDEEELSAEDVSGDISITGDEEPEEQLIFEDEDSLLEENFLNSDEMIFESGEMNTPDSDFHDEHLDELTLEEDEGSDNAESDISIPDEEKIIDAAEDSEAELVGV